MWIDIHSHVLPNVDDGAKDIDMCLDMLNILFNQSVDVLVCTPHYYSCKETVDSFLSKRNNEYKTINKFLNESCPKLLLGAEVRVEFGVSENDIEKLTIKNTNLILLEFLNSYFEDWMIGEIENIVYSDSLIPIFAHVERYLDLFSTNDWNKIFSFSGAIAQFSVESLKFRAVRSFARDLIKSNIPIILGSDAHNTTIRPPKFDVANKLFFNTKKYNDIFFNVKSTQQVLCLN